MLFNNLNKKAQSMDVGGILPIVILFIIITIALSLGSEVLTSLRDTQTNTITTTINNESLTWAGNNTRIVLSEHDIVDGSLLLYNNGTIFNQAGSLNYSFIYENHSIIIRNITGGAFQIITATLNLTYDYWIGSYPRNLTGYGLATQSTLSRWTPTIAMVIVFAIILGVIMIYLYQRFARE